VHYVNEEAVRDNEDIKKGMEELKTWDWEYGQTPLFTYTVEEKFSWGRVVSNISLSLFLPLI
jgi:lipoate-protein ligase A